MLFFSWIGGHFCRLAFFCWTFYCKPLSILLFFSFGFLLKKVVQFLYLVDTGHPWFLYFCIFIFFKNKMTINLNMFAPLIKYWIFIEIVILKLSFVKSLCFHITLCITVSLLCLLIVYFNIRPYFLIIFS